LNGKSKHRTSRSCESESEKGILVTPYLERGESYDFANVYDKSERVVCSARGAMKKDKEKKEMERKESGFEIQ